MRAIEAAPGEHVVLTGADRTPVYAPLTASDRTAIREILLETKKDLPEYWRTTVEPAVPVGF